MLKILLIVPYVTTPENLRNLPDEPSGLLYIATYANKMNEKYKYDINIKILDLQLEGKNYCIKTKRGYRSGLDDSAFKKILSEYKPNIVGITNNYSNATSDIFEICKIVKRKMPRCLVILGGAHPTVAHKEMIKHPEIDIIVRREGEITFWELIKKIYGKKSLSRVKGITYKKNGKVKINSEMPLISDLDILPIPNRSLIDYKRYYMRKKLTKSEKKKGNIISSRGCPFNCIFCSTQKVWGNKWRSRTPENIMKEIKYLHEKYNINEINFQDDQFALDKERLIKLFGLIIKSKLKIKVGLPSGISPSLIDDEIIDLMSKVGFYSIRFSVDVGTESARKFVRKPVNLKKIRKLVKKANSKGMLTDATFVIGYPHENEKDIKDTIKYSYSLHTDNVLFYIAQPHLGSDLYDIFLEKNMIDDEYHDFRHCTYGTEHISAKKLIKMTNKAMYGYFKYYLLHMFNPVYFTKELFPKISSPSKIYRYSKLVILPYILHNIRMKIGDKNYHLLIKYIRDKK